MVGITFKKKLLNVVHLETYSSYKEYQETHKLKVPLDSMIIYCIYKYCTSPFVAVKFVPVKTTPENEMAAVTLVEENLTFLLNEYEIPWPVALCVYPVIMAEDVIVTGLCAVARHICAFNYSRPIAQEHIDGLLGFRQSCLQAPNEVSIWTKFCEVDIIKTVKKVLSSVHMKKIPKNLVRFEDHLKKPVRVHNVYKIARDLVKENFIALQKAKADGLASTDQQANVEQQASAEQQVSAEQQASAKQQASTEQELSDKLHDSPDQQHNAEQVCVDQQVSVVQQASAEQQASACCSATTSNNKQTTAETQENAEQASAEQSESVEQQTSAKQQTIAEQQGNAEQVSAKQPTSVEQQTSAKQQANAEQQVSAAQTGNAEQQAIANKQDPKECGEGTSGTTRPQKSRKWKSNKKKETIIECSMNIEDLNVNHDYAEGPYLTLADLVLLPSYHVIIQSIGESQFESLLPFTYKWYKNIISLPKVQEMFMTYLNKFNLKPLLLDNVTMPTTEDVSLYKCDPKRHNPKKRMFTKEDDIENALSSITEGMELKEASNDFEPSFKWAEIPEGANPYAGYLPDARVQRKSQQLENLALAVLSIAKEGDLIVDFCCGSGHLGILLAYLLPRCTIILLENKVQSLHRARDRVHKMRLNNVFFYQCNVDFFIGEFEIGIGLHACGIASDLILDKCLKVKAKFVLSPCCYGSLHATDRLVYPRSSKFASVPIEQYLCIGHTADQTHKEHPLAVRGARCMTIIDSDRGRLAEELGYNVTLMRLKPLTCTPKNNLLIGVPKVPS